LISKLILVLFSVIILFQAHQVLGAEELPIITIDFVSGNIIDLDKSPQMIRAQVQIQNYDPRDGYHFMQVIKANDGEIIKDTEIFPKVDSNSPDDETFHVQILYYLEPGEIDENMIGDYTIRIYSEFGPSETVSTFSIVKSSISSTVTSNTVEEVVTSEEESEIENLVQSGPKIPSWVHDIFVWYAEESISENELLASLEYLISKGIINVDSN